MRFRCASLTVGNTDVLCRCQGFDIQQQHHLKEILPRFQADDAKLKRIMQSFASLQARAELCCCELSERAS